jgi:PAS domain S-box-containing protein
LTSAQAEAFVAALAEVLVVADPGGRIIVWNAGAERLFGWSAEEAMGETLDLIIPEKQRSRHWAGYREVMASGVTRYGDQLLEVPALHRDGRRLSIAFTVTLIEVAGEVCGIAAVIRDQTRQWEERRRREARVPLPDLPSMVLPL